MRSAPSEVFSELLSSGPRGRSATVVTLPVPVAPAMALLRAARSVEAMAWASPDGGRFEGLGVARSIEASGPGRFERVRDEAREVFAGLSDVRAPGASLAPAPRLFGGFAFHPGSAAHGHWSAFGDAAFVLPRWRYASDGTSAWLSFAFTGAPEASARLELAALLAVLEGEAPPAGEAHTGEVVPLPLEAWTEKMREIAEAIDEGRLAKVVAARRTGIALPAPRPIADVLGRLGRENPTATLFCFARAGAAFVGATPERLVRKHGRAFVTEAVAGSALGAAFAAWPERAPAKEMAEHRFVVEAILEALRPLAPAIEHAKSPEVRRLAHIAHLVTPIAGTLETPVHVLDLVARLHPTPAVAGVPRAEAVEWILAHEQEPRGWYSGPVGWIDASGDGDFAVALRSGLITDTEAYAYAGAGIVAGSDPVAEYAETESKQRAILGALGAA